MRKEKRPRGTPRPKPQLSCHQCKSKKLKCDRSQPCRNCLKLPPGSCSYAAEHSGNDGVVIHTPPAPGTQTLQSNIILSKDMPQILSSVSGSSASAEQPEATSHWRVLLDNMANIAQPDASRLDNQAGSATFVPFPSLLFSDKSMLMAGSFLKTALIPPSVAILLLEQFCTEEQLPWLAMVVHIPTFLAEARVHLNDPDSASLPWTAMLYAVLSIVAQEALQVEIDLGIALEDAAKLSHACKLRASDCLKASDYGNPTAYTVEAMILYLICEHRWAKAGDGHFRASIVLQIILRLAVRMGYHRDPYHKAGIDVFHGEMQRRLWLLLTHLDLMLSSQSGLPCSLDERISDVLPPQQIHGDEMLHTMASAFALQPSTRYNAAGLYDYKTKLLRVQVKASALRSNHSAPPLGDSLRLDHELTTIIGNSPDWLRLDPETPIAILSSLPSFDRLVDSTLVGHSTRMAIHQTHLVQAHSKQEFSDSRDRCLAAAFAVLELQSLLVSSDVSTLAKRKWRILSLASHNFVHAAMLLCLDLDLTLRRDNSITQSSCRASKSRKQLDALQTCCEQWPSFVREGAIEANALKVLQILVQRFSGVMGARMNGQSTSSMQEADVTRMNATVAMPSQESCTANNFQYQNDGYASTQEQYSTMPMDFDRGFSQMLDSFDFDIDHAEWDMNCLAELPMNL